MFRKILRRTLSASGFTDFPHCPSQTDMPKTHHRSHTFHHGKPATATLYTHKFIYAAYTTLCEVFFMKHLKYTMIIGALFVLITGSLSHFLYDWTGQNTVVCSGKRIHMGTYETAVFSHAAVFPDYPVSIWKKNPLPCPFSLLWNHRRNPADSCSFLCLHRGFGQKYLSSGHRHIYFERSDFLPALLPLYPVLPPETIYLSAVPFGGNFLSMLFAVYLSSACT